MTADKERKIFGGNKQFDISRTAETFLLIIKSSMSVTKVFSGMETEF